VYRYLRGAYKGALSRGSEMIVVEAGGIGYEVIVPPVVQQALDAGYEIDAPIVLYVSALTGRDQPWPTLFGFLQPEERDFWELLISVPRVGGKLAARAMSVPVYQFAQWIQEGNKLALDNLPGITMDGAEKIVAALRKKVAPFARPSDGVAAGARRAPGPEDELVDDAVQALVVMGEKRPDAQRGVELLLARRDELELVSVQDILRAYLRTKQTGGR
jgi:Holliday junction DNA helicase RuvA